MNLHKLMGATHADHHTCYGMKTHNDQQGNEVKLMVVRSHDMQIFGEGTSLNSPQRERKLLSLMTCHQQES
jgi:hypothetical protein